MSSCLTLSFYVILYARTFLSCPYTKEQQKTSGFVYFIEFLDRLVLLKTSIYILNFCWHSSLAVRTNFRYHILYWVQGPFQIPVHFHRQYHHDGYNLRYTPSRSMLRIECIGSPWNYFWPVW